MNLHLENPTHDVVLTCFLFFFLNLFELDEIEVV